MGIETPFVRSNGRRSESFEATVGSASPISNIVYLILGKYPDEARPACGHPDFPSPVTRLASASSDCIESVAGGKKATGRRAKGGSMRFTDKVAVIPSCGTPYDADLTLRRRAF